MQTQSTRHTIREQLQDGFNGLRAMQTELFETHGIRSYVDGCRLVSKVPGGKYGEFNQIQLVDGAVVWGAVEESDE